MSLPSRRAFLALATSAGSAVAYSWVATHIPTIDIGKHIRRLLVDRAGFDALLSPSPSLKFWHGSDHYLLKGPHPDNVSTADSFLAFAAQIAGTNIQDDSSRYSLDAASDWVLVGAPSSNEVSRTLMQNAAADLKYNYHYDDELVTLERFTADGQRQSKARRSLVLDLSSGAQWRPAEGATQTEDYLLVTRFPPRASVGARTIIGGTHGSGTRAVANLLSTFPLSGRQRKELERGKHTGYQLLARVEVETAAGATAVAALTVLDVVSL